MNFRQLCRKDYRHQLKGCHKDEIEKRLIEEKNLFDIAEIMPDEHGGCLYFVWGDVAFLYYLLVTEPGKGHGSRLLNRFEKEMKNRGVKRVKLNLFNHNKPAKKLYKNYKIVSLFMEKTLP